MKQVLPVAIAAVVTLAASAEARAETATLALSGVTVEVPAGWTLHRSERELGLIAPDGSVGLSFTDEEAAALDDAWLAVDSRVWGMVDTLDMDVAGEGWLGGMPARFAHGQGEEAGVWLSIDMAVMTTPAAQQVSLVVFAREEAGALEADLQAILGSIAAAPSDPFAGLPYVAAVRDAIDGNDVDGLLAMMPARVEIGGKLVKKSKLKKALRKWRKKRAGVAGYLGLERGAWQVVSIVDGHYMLYRDGGGARHTYVLVSNLDGVWQVLGTGSFEVLG
jgi:hypothetical protein